MSESKRSVVAPKELQERVKKLIEKEGAVGASKELGVSRESIARIAGGIPVRAGTIALVTQKFSEK